MRQVTSLFQNHNYYTELTSELDNFLYKHFIYPYLIITTYLTKEKKKTPIKLNTFIIYVIFVSSYLLKLYTNASCRYIYIIIINNMFISSNIYRRSVLFSFK